MSNLNENDIAEYMEIAEHMEDKSSIVVDYRLNEGDWEQLISYETTNDEHIQEWCAVPVINVPVSELLLAYEALLMELSFKEISLSMKKEDYNNREFEIIYLSDIDFKALYGSTSEKVRKHHALKELKELNDKITSLELSVNYLKRYIPFLRELIKTKQMRMG